MTPRSKSVGPGLCLVTLLLLTGPTWASVGSTFDADSDGWSFQTYHSGTFQLYGSYGVAYHPSGGNPDGYVSADDPDQWTCYFVAPAKFLGDALWAYDGRLAFDRRINAQPEPVPNDVVLWADSLILVCDTNSPGTQWTHSEVTFWSAEGWFRHTGEAATYLDMLYVLAHLDRLLIRAEHITGSDVGDLDNILLSGSYSEVNGAQVPTSQLSLHEPQPNPTRAMAALRFVIEAPGEVRLDVYDATGRHVRTLEDGLRLPGEYVASWDCRTCSGTPVAAGCYFVRLATGQWTTATKVYVVR